MSQKHQDTREGGLTQGQLATLEDDKRHKGLAQPTTEAEKGSSKHLPRDAAVAFFAPQKTTTTAPMAATTTTDGEQESIPINFCQAVSMLVSDPAFAKTQGKGGTVGNGGVCK